MVLAEWETDASTVTKVLKPLRQKQYSNRSPNLKWTDLKSRKLI